MLRMLRKERNARNIGTQAPIHAWIAIALTPEGQGGQRTGICTISVIVSPGREYLDKHNIVAIGCDLDRELRANPIDKGIEATSLRS